jgi:hypothetical protein
MSGIDILQRVTNTSADKNTHKSSAFSECMN